MKFAKMFIGSSLVLWSLNSWSIGFVNSSEPMASVQKSYLDRSFKQMALDIKAELLANPESPYKDEMLNLFLRAREEAGLDGISPDWTLPEEVTKMKINIRRRQGEGLSFQLGSDGRYKTKNLAARWKSLSRQAARNWQLG
jgi:hypothetical protein